MVGSKLVPVDGLLIAQRDSVAVLIRKRQRGFGLGQTLVGSLFDPVECQLRIRRDTVALSIGEAERELSFRFTLLGFAFKRGDRVLTGGGIFGRIARVEGDDELIVEIAPEVRVRVARGTVSEVMAKGEPAKASTNDNFKGKSKDKSKGKSKDDSKGKSKSGVPTVERK